MKSIAIVALCALTAGCCPPATIIKEPIEVKVPVAMGCKLPTPPRPEWALDRFIGGEGSLFDIGSAALLEVEQRRAYEKELETSLANCK